MPLQGIWHIWHGDMFMRLAENFGVGVWWQSGKVKSNWVVYAGSTSYMLHLLLLLG